MRQPSDEAKRYGIQHVGARLSVDLVSEFDKMFPHVSRQWFISECFRQAVEHGEEGGIKAAVASAVPKAVR